MDNPVVPDIVPAPESVTLEDLITQFNVVSNDTATTRSLLQGVLVEAVEKLHINPHGDPEQIVAQLKILDTLNDLISCREKSFHQRITAGNKKESDANTAIGTLAVELLRRITYSTTLVTNVTNDDISAGFDKLNEVTANIPVDKGETRFDSADLSE